MPSQQSRRAIRITAYVMLLLSAGTVFLLSDRLWNAARVGSLPMWAPLAPATLFTLFVFVYTIDRWLQVRRSQYPAGRALFQVGFALVFLTLLWPNQAAEFRVARDGHAERWDAADLLVHRDASVRAAACELLGLSHRVNAYEAVERLASEDTSIEVRKRCTRALSALHTAKTAVPPTPDPASQ